MEQLKKIYRLLSPKFQSLSLEYKVDNRPRYGHGKAPHRQLNEIINSGREEYAGLLQSFLSHKKVFHQIKKCSDETDAGQPCWNNNFLPGLDIVSIYGIIAHYQPKKYVEIGSGNSTKIAHKAISDLNWDTHITSIDPYPRVEVDSLSDTIVRKPIEQCDLSIYDTLEANDIAFLDGSHCAFPNSDVTVFFLDILPRLKKGVIIHIHDVYLPYDYPQFMCDRFYSEQYLIATAILANPEKYKVLFPNFFVSTDSKLSGILEPVWAGSNLKGVEKHGAGFWMQIG